MSFADFAASIASPDLQRIALHWNEARGTRAMPAWGDLRPGSIAAQLPLVWCYRYDAQEDEFIGRLAGDAVARIFGQAFRGTRLMELQAKIDVTYLSERFRKVIKGPMLFRSDGDVFHQTDRHGYGERIIMPLSDSGGEPDGIFGATRYETSYQPQKGAISEVWCKIAS